MRRGNDAHVHLLSLRGSEALEGAFLEHAQQLGLQVEREVADLVEEERAPMRQLESSLPRGHRAGECAARVTEQLALDQ